MGAEFSTESRSDVKSDQIKLKELSPSCLVKLKNQFEKNPLNTSPDKKQFMTILGVGKRETDIIFDYFDMDGNGQLDSYEFICAIAMLVHSSIDLKADFMFKMFDFDGNNFLTREEVVHLLRTLAIANKRPVITNEIEKRTDEFIKNADLDLDKKISMKEFQSYAAKHREIFLIFDNYSVLMNNNPMAGTITSNSKKVTSSLDEDEDAEDNEGGNNNNFNVNEEEINGDEMDPDLMSELNKDKIAGERSEKDYLIKQGVEYKLSDKQEDSNGGGAFLIEEEAAGDQFGALKPWVTNLVHTVPSSYKPSSQDSAAPDVNMELEFVHGYRCHDTRNNLRYTAEGHIVYHTAAVGIVYNKDEHSQKFFFDHMDDITALAIHPNKKYVATGEIGPYPLISVWDTTTMTPIAKMNGPLQKGINHLAFSKDGKYLVATAADDDHNVAVFDWAKGNAVNTSEIKGKRKAEATVNPVVATGKGTRANILGICFDNTGETVALTCVKEIDIVTFKGGKLVVKKATGLRAENLTSIMCGTYVNNTLVCGSFNGNLLTFMGASFAKSIKAHTSAVNCITPRDNNTGFFTGGNDGVVLVFDNKFAITNKFDLMKDTRIASLNARIRSVCEDENGNVLVGTRGSDIIEFVGQTPQVLMRGHFDLELWGLCVHPNQNKYYTVGQDKMLAIWDIETRKIEKYTTIIEPAEVMHISPDGKDIAIGCKSGNLHIYDAIKLEKKFTKSERKNQPVSIVKYSPDGKYLAVGGVDSMIFVYAGKQYTRHKRLIGHTSRLTHLDWSEDSEIIQSNSTSYELLYHAVSSGVQITKISSLRDTDWYSWSCVLGWPVQGIWPPCSSGDDINACDRDKRKKVMVTADDFGKVKLFKYPSPVDKASFKPYVGHSSHVTCVRFTNSSSHIVSTGGNDKAIFQWKFSYEDEAELEAADYEDIVEEDHNPNDEQGDYFKLEEMPEGTEFGAVKPWLGELNASIPRSFVKSKNAHLAPTQNIRKLKYVFGYRAFDTRMNVKYTSDLNKIVYHTAALGVVLDKATNTQQFFTHHKEDIVALAIHPNKRIVATGQMAKAGEAKMLDLFVWDTTKLPEETNCEWSDNPPVLGKEIINLKGCHLRAIRILSFSPDGTKLLSGGQDDDNSVAVHDWARSQLIVKTPVDKASVLDAQWINNEEFITVGPKHIKFFSLKGRTVNGKRGVFGKIPVEPLTCVASAFGNGTIVTGTSKGNLIVWMGGSAIMSKPLCSGPVYCLYAKNNLLYAGGFNGEITVFTNSKLLEKKDAKIDITQMTRCDPGIRSIDINDSNNILIGTKGGDIIEITGKSQKTLMNSHAEEELWGLTVNPINPYLIATGGGDKSLRIWDIKSNKQIKFWMCDQDFRAIDWSKDGKCIILAGMQGKIYYIAVDGANCALKGEPYQSIFKGPKQWIQEMKISPNNKYAAFGSHCGVGPTFSKIEVLNITNNAKCPFTQYGLIDPKITSALTHLDWDVESEVIVCNSLAFELKFCSVSAKKRIDSSSARDREWDTWTCIFGFPVQGIWPPASTGYVVNYTCVNQDKLVVATGDDFSLVKLFKYPCVVEHANFKAYKGHSSHVCKVRFTAKDQFLVSVGGNDKSVFIWETDFGKGGEEDEENPDEENLDQENEDEENIQDDENPEEENPEEENPEEDNQEEEENPDDMEQNYEEEEVEEPEPEPEPPKKNINTKSNIKQTQPVVNTKQTQPVVNTKQNTQPVVNTKSQPNSNKPVPIVNQTAKTSNKTQDTTNNTTKPVTQTTNNTKTNQTSKPISDSNSQPNKATATNNTKLNSASLNTKSTANKQITTKNEIKNKPTNKMLAFEDDEFQGDEAGVPDSNTEPWRSAIDPPDNADKLPTDLMSALKCKLQLDYVFGYRTKDTRNNLFYLKSNVVVYQAACLGIIHYLDSNTQTFLTGHKEEILSIAIDSTRSLIATGENNSRSMDNTPALILWDSAGNQIAKFQGMFSKGIINLSFSPNGKRLAAVSLDDSHTIYIFDIVEKKLIKSFSGDPDHKILDICFRTETEFATVGIKHYKFWMMNDDQAVSKDGVFGTSETNRIDNKIGIIKTINGNFITGSSTGEVTIWKEDKILMMKKVHVKNVDSISVKDEYIVTGGRDCAIVISDKDLNELRRIVLDSSKLNSVEPVPRSIEIGVEKNDRLLLGTLSSEIYELVFDSGSILYGEYKSKNYQQAHYSRSPSENNEITGITYWSGKDIFITVSEDATVRFWDVDENKQMDFYKLDYDESGKKITTEGAYKAQCIDIDPNGPYLAIGFMDGSVRIYKINRNFELIKIIKCRNAPCSDVKYSPDYTNLAIATKEGITDILNTQEYIKLHSLEGHNGPVTRIDWSTDSSHLCSTSATGELNYYNIAKGVRVIRTSDLKNEKWNSFNRPYGWPVQGIWAKGDMIVSCDRSKGEIKNSKLLAVGNDSGLLRLYKYPCLSGDQKHLEGYGHGQKINNVRFSESSNVLVTASADGCVFKWKLA